MSAPLPPGFVPDQRSTFDRIWSDISKPDSAPVADQVKDYAAGKMAPDAAAKFRADVESGRVMLPRGESLRHPGPAPAASSPALPPGFVIDGGQDGAAQIPGPVPGLPTVPGGPATTPQAPQTLGQQAIGAGEAGLTALTGATGGTLGMVAGTLHGLAQQILSGQFGTQQAADLVQRSAEQGAQALTYQPRTVAGQQQTQALGELTQQLVPVMPLAGELAGIGAGIKAARGGGAPAAVLARAGSEGVARDVAGSVAMPAELAGVLPAGVAGDAAAGAVAAGTDMAAAGAQRVAAGARTAAGRAADVAQSAATLPRRAAEKLGIANAAPAESAATPGSQASGGAAGTDLARQRIATAEQLGFTGDTALTEGQATRGHGAQAFERETAKQAEVGAPLRERFDAQNRKLGDVVDRFADEAGGETIGAGDTGHSVKNALQASADAEWQKVGEAYTKARESGAMADMVPAKQLTDMLNATRSAEGTAPVVGAARKELVRLGGATVDEHGMLVPGKLSVNDAELFRQFVGDNIAPTGPDLKYGPQIQRITDALTEGVGGPEYRMARRARENYANRWENRAVTADLLGTKSTRLDAKVAPEAVYQRVVTNGSAADLAHTRSMLRIGGETGAQAWKNLQGQALRELKDAMTSRTRNERGDYVVTAPGFAKAIDKLDKAGKLEILFGQQGAARLRDLREISEVLLTSPPGAVNTSGTAAALIAALDLTMSAVSGIPAPIASILRIAAKRIKDGKVKARVMQSLNYKGPGTAS